MSTFGTVTFLEENSFLCIFYFVFMIAVLSSHNCKAVAYVSHEV